MSTRIAASDRWRKIIQQHRHSGLAVTVFCRRTGVPQSSFFAWRRKLQAEVTYAEVKLPRERIVDADGIEWANWVCGYPAIMQATAQP